MGLCMAMGTMGGGHRMPGTTTRGGRRVGRMIGRSGMKVLAQAKPQEKEAMPLQEPHLRSHREEMEEERRTG